MINNVSVSIRLLFDDLSGFWNQSLYYVLFTVAFYAISIFGWTHYHSRCFALGPLNARNVNISLYSSLDNCLNFMFERVYVFFS